MLYFCTYFDRNYLVKGLALIRSLRSVVSEEFKIFVVTMDEFSRVILKALQIPCVELIPLHLIEELDGDLLRAKLNRSAVEYIWTTTSTIILRLLERNPEVEMITYLDADLYFYSTMQALYHELGQKSVLIHEHRFVDKFKYQEENGIFNVGLLIFRNDLAGREVLLWWRERCNEWCYARAESGKFGDQGYLNDWPTRFSQVLVTKNIGAGVAPWNDSQYIFSCNSAGVPCVNGVPIIFYHFHSFIFVNPMVVIPTRDPIYTPTSEVAKLCFLPYIHALQNAIGQCRSVYPQFSFGLYNNNTGLAPNHALLAHRAIEGEVAKLSLPQKPQLLDSQWLWYC